MLLPVWCLPRRAYSSDIVGTALLAAARGAGYARAAVAAGAPTATVRDWLRAVGRSAPALTAQAVTITGAAGDADACWPYPSRPCSALTSAVNALAAAARAFHLVLTRPRPSPASHPGTGTGIDYLAILAERHRRHLLHGIRLADPTGAAAALSPWQAINVLTAGRLLTSEAANPSDVSGPATPSHGRVVLTLTPRPTRCGRSRHADDQAATVTTIHRSKARKRRSLILINRDAVILIQRGGPQKQRDATGASAQVRCPQAHSRSTSRCSVTSTVTGGMSNC